MAESFPRVESAPSISVHAPAFTPAPAAPTVLSADEGAQKQASMSASMETQQDLDDTAIVLSGLSTKPQTAFVNTGRDGVGSSSEQNHADDTVEVPRGHPHGSSCPDSHRESQKSPKRAPEPKKSIKLEPKMEVDNTIRGRVSWSCVCDPFAWLTVESAQRAGPLIPLFICSYPA